ncbi:MAG: T9SS type A sorting domain-containing protein [Flavobacteriales bacterium]|nr:T9SS type A sorting domain-containing protein [Flavobacteriales bacterium]
MKHALLLSALIATQAHAQIIYTDVVPDATYNLIGQTCNLDLDNNGQTDFQLYRTEISNTCGFGCVLPLPVQQIKIDRVGTNEIAYVTPWNSIQWPASLPFGQLIDANTDMSVTNHLVREYRPGGSCPGGMSCVPGPPITWALVSQAYLGLRFDIAGATHYGWARLSVPSATSFTLKDYAYNSVPDEGILAGDVGSITTGITSTALRGMQVSPNPFSSTLSIALPTGTTGSVGCRVLSLTGQGLVTRTVVPISGPSSINLDLGSLAPGTYLLEMQVDGERMVRKVLKE